MCDFGLVSLGVGLATSLMGGIAQRNQANAQAQVYRRQADLARTEATLRSQEVGRITERQLGRQRALAGASGTDVNSGSILDITADTAAAGARDRYNTLFMGAQRAANLEASASNMENAGQGAFLGSLLNFGTRVATSGYVNSLFGPSDTGPTGRSYADELAAGVRPI